MNVIDAAIYEHWQDKTMTDRFLAVDGLYQGEKAVLERIAPDHFSDEDVLAFVFYHLHGHVLPEDFFIQRRAKLGSDRENK